MSSLAQTDHRSDSVTFTILEQIAERTNTDPMDLPPMYEAIDPDIFRHLCGTDQYDETVTLSFHYQGYVVTIDGRGHVELSED